MYTPTCKVFTAFENILCHAQSSEFDGLLARIPVHTQNTMFDFSLFWQEQAWASAVHAASDSDIIIVSLSGRSDLPLPVKRWMESWPHSRPDTQAALVVFFETMPADISTQNELIAYCQNLADRHGLSFFCNRVGLQPFTSDLSAFESNHPDLISCAR